MVRVSERAVWSLGILSAQFCTQQLLNQLWKGGTKKLLCAYVRKDKADGSTRERERERREEAIWKDFSSTILELEQAVAPKAQEESVRERDFITPRYCQLSFTLCNSRSSRKIRKKGRNGRKRERRKERFLFLFSA